MGKILDYDGVVIGAGHNGMICGGYLGKSGQKVLVVENEFLRCGIEVFEVFASLWELLEERSFLIQR